ncbi:unnamed protein product [Onchocerca flexuosa]|uniref:Uncharacterized protein n=1 Tax=Onchocerca flexuosa TaxID=387005 RepID=A0A183HWD8_9BILA|nr:unnamed protein product [Onchocerca flexuosa]
MNRFGDDRKTFDIWRVCVRKRPPIGSVAG